MKSRFLTLTLAFLALLVLLAQGCGDDEGASSLGGKPNKKDGGDDEGTICLLNNCRSDAECADCSNGKKYCSLSEKRCIACGPNAKNAVCKTGQYCTKYGECVSSSLKCDEDANGVPTIACRADADCGACGPQFRVCDPTSNRCVGCTANNVANCQSTDVCKNGFCTPKCPESCTLDDDCGECGVPEVSEARACNKHVCAQCSPTKPCPDGDRCDFSHGTCVKRCGLSGRESTAACTESNNCAACYEATNCKIPLNGGEGKCSLPAPGCSEVTKIKLPSPYDRLTNACSTDVDCANVSADLNVGKIVRDITGIKQVKDANLSYSMHACASVEVLDRSCGICVPCKTDYDCTDIDIEDLAEDMFGKLESKAASLLLDKAFGPNDHKVHMFCQNVLGEYGVCLPCPNILSACAQTNYGVPPSGTCDHDVCVEGTPLGVNCDVPCAAKVCEKDPFCCTDQWDSQCVLDVETACRDHSCLRDTCMGRPAGWYCFRDANQGAFQCSGEPDQEATVGGHQCGGGGRSCKPIGPGPKDPAELCTTTSDDSDECPPGAAGKPKCLP